MNIDPCISVIMPVFNSEKYLEVAIDSIIAQSFTDYELIIIDDNSTDASRTIIEKYALSDSRVKVFKNIYNKGVAGALNTGLKFAVGKYIARADSDDINRPYRLKLQFEYLEQHPNVYLIGGGYAVFNKQGHRINAIHPTSSLEIEWRFISDTFFCHPTVMFRREVFEKIGNYVQVEAEDFEYFSRVVKIFKCSNLSEILIDYREHETNRSSEFKDKILDSVKKTSRGNYLYYTGNTDYADDFFRYQNKKIIHGKSFFPFLVITLKILNKIRNAQRISFFNYEFMRLLYIIMSEIINISIRGTAKFLLRKK